MSVIKRQTESGTLILKNPFPEMNSRLQALVVVTGSDQLAEDSAQAEFEQIGLRNFIGASTDGEMKVDFFFDSHADWDGNCDSIIPSEVKDQAETACAPSAKTSACRFM
jgi:hypothetical protein